MTTLNLFEVRGAMIKECASYTCTKPKITVRSEVPVLSSIEQAEAFLATVAAENDLDPIELMTAVRTWIDSRRAGKELDLKVNAQGGGGDAVIQITGGLPPLPGTSIIMDDTAIGMNGHKGPAIEHEVTPTLTESTQSEGQDA